MIVTFEQLAAEVAAFHAAEAANRTPLAIACRSLETLREALAEMETADRADVLDDLQTLIEEQFYDPEWRARIVAREG